MEEVTPVVATQPPTEHREAYGTAKRLHFRTRSQGRNGTVRREHLHFPARLLADHRLFQDLLSFISTS